MSKSLKHYNKRVSVRLHNHIIGCFDDLYFAPVEIEDIFIGLGIYKETGKAPIIKVHVDGLDGKESILNVIQRIKNENIEIGFYRRISLEVRIRKIKDMDELPYFLQKLGTEYKIAVVVNWEILDKIKVLSLLNVTFVRVNYGKNYIKKEIQLPFRDFSTCYKLCRLIISNYDFSNLFDSLQRSGFNGVQLIKERSNTEKKLDKKIKNQLYRLQNELTPFQIFLEENLDDICSPSFFIRDDDHGTCYASILFMTIRANDIYFCPFKSEHEKYKMAIDDYIKKEEPYNSFREQCFDCGYISDNILYRAILENIH